MQIEKINYVMSLCLDEAQRAFDVDEVPIGAVITNKFGDILASAFNTKEKEQQVCNHAEILAITKASESIKNWRLIDGDLYVTLEPCPMCMSAISQSRIRNLYFGTYDPKGGAISLGYNLHKDSRLNHKVNVYGGFKHIQCAQLISRFFKQKRRRYKA